MELIKPQKGTNYNIEHDIQNLTTIEQGFEQIDNKITNDITSSIDELKDKVDNDITAAITELDNKVDTEIVTAIDNLETKVNTEISESITALDNKVTTSLQEQAESLKKEISDQIAKVVANSPEDFDTLKEISDWISGHSSDASAMNSIISGNTSAINQEILDRQAADTALQTNIDKKVDKVDGKGLSTNDFTDTYKSKLDGIEAEANKTIVDAVLSSTSTNPVQNKIVDAALNNKVDKVSGKGLSTNDYTTAEKNKLAGIAEGANKTVVESTIESNTTNPVQCKAIKAALDKKVDKVDGKGLSTNDYTDNDKSKLNGIEKGANKTVVDSSLKSDSTNPVQNKVVNAALSGKANSDHTHNSLKRTQIARGTNLNSLTTEGEYYAIDNTTYTNAPCQNFTMQVIKLMSGYVFQILYAYSSSRIYTRSTMYNGGSHVWTSWVQSASTTDYLKIRTSAPSEPKAGDIWIG